MYINTDSATHLMGPDKCNVLVCIYSRKLGRQLSYNVSANSLISHSDICIDENDSASLVVGVPNNECSTTLAHVQTGTDLGEGCITHEVDFYNRSKMTMSIQLLQMIMSKQTHPVISAVPNPSRYCADAT